ncbi:family 43 glycosylhydrolase [Olivibacter domesticus]|uniref:F5/8 type C domain-containing protein n=1 Tax=Olivibacter domesticus TaxID=407022 RepID=A0A1H7TNP1_OLID1|nr:family 43 glycosylhydrolase [Olivibacter domesticus]SEL86165.1 F5/8 type C domain-containing protein [Olivibacter domesticus]
MFNTKKILTFFVFLVSFSGFAQQLKHTSPQTGNPIIPGYFADPTVKKWGDTYYIYATTDGNGFGLGPSQVWTSKDFVNWYMQPMNWPSTPIYWAPDVNKASDGKYYMYYSQPVELYGASSNSPVGPWTSLLPDNKPVVPNHFVPNVITLDGQTFLDDDGKMYMYWGTWGIYPNSGCGMGLLNADMKSFAKTDIIPNTIAKDFFEAPFMFKRNGIYYLMYSAEHCEDASYKVHYVMSKTGPLGPFTYGENSPILVTNEEGTVHGPGHNSVLQEGNDFYIVYHRHNNPHSGGGFHRQIAADKLEFDAIGNIKKIVPTHTGIGGLAKNTISGKNLALGRSVSASSTYSDDFMAAYAADDNNGTLWKAADNMHDAWWQVDLGKEESIRSVLTQFEYATWYYQYLVEYSSDGNYWETFADRTKNTQWGSPMKDYGNVMARYLRITIKDTQLAGLNKAIWNVKIYSEANVGREEGKFSDPQQPVGRQQSMGLLVDLEADQYDLQASGMEVSNKGVLGGAFQVKNGAYLVDLVQGKKAFIFDGQSYWQSQMLLPATLSGNSSFTISAWVHNSEIAKEEPLMQWASGGRDLTHASLGYGSDQALGAAVHGGWSNLPFKITPAPNQWHHIALVFDGTEERLYVDGMLENEGNRMLFLQKASDILIGTDRRLQHYFSGALASLKIFDRALGVQELKQLQRSAKRSTYLASFEAKDLTFGPVKAWINKGYGDARIDFQDRAAELLAYKQQMALSLKGGKASLLHYLQPKLDSMATYTLTWVHANNKEQDKGDWKLSTLIKKHNTIYLYIANKLVKESSTADVLKDLLPAGDFYLRSFYLLDEALDVIQLERLANTLVVNMESVEKLKLTYSVKPKWLTEHLAFMQVDTSLADKGYQFSFKDAQATGSTAWQSVTHYLAQGLASGEKTSFKFFAKDRFGRVWVSAEAPLEGSVKNLLTNRQEVKDFAKDFSVQRIWDGMEGGIADSVKLSQRNDTIVLASAKSAWDGSSKKGPFLYKNTTENFLMQLKVSDIAGLRQKRPLGANEVGLMLRYVSKGKEDQLLQNGIMLGWGIGNIVTDLAGVRRQQHNNTGFDFYSYLQIQREGRFIFVRGSKDGENWQEFPGSPYEKPQWIGENLQIGPYQASYGEKKGFGMFSDFIFTTN